MGKGVSLFHISHVTPPQTAMLPSDQGPRNLSLPARARNLSYRL